MEDVGVLVCGGTDRRSYDSKICWIFSERWRQYEHSLNMGRIGSFIFQNGRKLIIKGGESSESESGCEYSYEELDLDHLEEGWKLKYIDFEVTEDLCYGSNAVTFNVPCNI